MKRQWHICFLTLSIFLFMGGCRPDHPISEDSAKMNLTEAEPTPIQKDSSIFRFEEAALIQDYLNDSLEVFVQKYSLDTLYQSGITIMDDTEIDVFTFHNWYQGEIMPGIQIGTPLAEVKEKLDNPDFSNPELDMIGYLQPQYRLAFIGRDQVESVRMIKVYETPEGYEDILTEFFSEGMSIQHIAETYLDYSFSGQYGRGGSSLVYPFGLILHSYNNQEAAVYQNFQGDIPEDPNLQQYNQDYFIHLLELHLTRQKNRENIIGAVEVSPDGSKTAEELTWIQLYDYNKIYISANDHTAAPYSFFPGHWIDQMVWLDNRYLYLTDNMSFCSIYDTETKSRIQLLDQINEIYPADIVLVDQVRLDQNLNMISIFIDNSTFYISYTIDENGFTYILEQYKSC